MPAHPRKQKILNPLNGGFLAVPLLMALSLGSMGAVLSFLETSQPHFGQWLPGVFFPSSFDPAVAENILNNIATAMMTVVSIVFAVLLMTLTLTSTQFSPRIIVAFVRDKITQQTLGIFLGTFLYCLAALPFIKTTANPFAPAITIYGGMLLALACVAWLLFFINHISKAVSVNHIVHKIARDTEAVIETIMPDKRHALKFGEYQKTETTGQELQVLSLMSGYVRSVNERRLFDLARQHHLVINVIRRVGHFVPEGVPVMSITGASEISPKLEASLLKAFHLGPTRVLEQDIEFGILQIVDIALKAISPAVNDPSTAITCIDQLSSILIRVAARESPKTMFYDTGTGKLLLSLPWLGFERLLDTAFEQIRAYSTTDVAVCMRLLRAFGDIAVTLPKDDTRKILVDLGKRLIAGCEEKSGEDVLREMKNRLAALEKMAE